MGNDRADRLAGKATIASDLRPGRSENVEELKTLHKAKHTTPLVAWRREAWTEEALDDLP